MTMKWVPAKSLDGPIDQSPPYVVGQDIYPPPPSDQWCATYPIRDAEFIRDLEMALHNEAQPARRAAIIQKFLDDYYRAPVVTHWAARGHDRCWENDAALYRAFGLAPGDEGLPPRADFRANCQAYENERYNAGKINHAFVVNASGCDEYHGHNQRCGPDVCAYGLGEGRLGGGCGRPASEHAEQMP